MSNVKNNFIFEGTSLGFDYGGRIRDNIMEHMYIYTYIDVDTCSGFVSPTPSLLPGMTTWKIFRVSKTRYIFNSALKWKLNSLYLNFRQYENFNVFVPLLNFCLYFFFWSDLWSCERVFDWEYISSINQAFYICDND